jgi:hypothetical protein
VVGGGCNWLLLVGRVCDCDSGSEGGIWPQTRVYRTIRGIGACEPVLVLVLVSVLVVVRGRTSELASPLRTAA